MDPSAPHSVQKIEVSVMLMDRQSIQDMNMN